jgi:hypothetical protein
MASGAQTSKRLLLNIKNIIIVILTPIVLLPLILLIDGNVSNNIFTFRCLCYLYDVHIHNIFPLFSEFKNKI